MGASAEERAIKLASATEPLYVAPKATTMGERRMKRPWAREQILIALSAETLDAKGRKTKKLRIIIDRLLNAAMAGEQWAIQEVLNRVDGKPSQLLGSDPNNPLPGGAGGLTIGKLIVEYVDAPESQTIEGQANDQ